MVRSALCGFESGFDLRVEVQAEAERGVEMDVVEGEEEDDDRERGGG